MTVTPTPVETITTAASGLESDLVAVAAVGLGVGAVVFALRKGWRLLKGFTS